MKLFVKLMLALVVLALLLPFTFLKDERGNTLMSLSDYSMPDFSMPDLKMPDFPGVPSGKSLVPSINGSAGMDVFYKWHDAEGNVHFTTEPPADGVDYMTKEFDPDANVIQAVEVPDPETTTEKSATAPQREVSSEVEQPNVYDVERIKKLFEDTENIEKLFQQRKDNQNSALN
jgi:hypothetical protein